jgi:DNA-binding LacI/PurR family transcriptional regulator
MLSYGDEGPAMVEPVIAHVNNLGSQIAGAMCFLRSGCQPMLDEFDRRDIPWVTINRASEHALHNFVAHEVFAGARLMGGCFARMNIQRVVVLSDPLETGRSAGDKLFGCIRGYVESGGSVGNVEFVSTKAHTDQAGYEAMKEYLEKGNKPQAVLCAGDLLAFGGMRACRERGLSVPGDVGFIGTTGLHAAQYFSPSLTVLEAPMQRMGEEVARMLLEMSREGVRRMAGRFVPGKLVMRDSFKVPEQILAEVQEMMGRTP